MKIIPKIGLFMLLIFVYSCQGKHKGDHDHNHSHSDSHCQSDDDHSHSHDHDDEHIPHPHDDDDHGIHTFVSYGDKYEAYMKIEPSSTKCTLDLAVYISSMENFKPILADKVQAVWVSEGRTVQLNERVSRIEGIVRFSLPCDVASTDGDLSLTFEKGGKEESILFEQINFNSEVYHVDFGNNEVVKFPKEKSWKVDFATDICQTKAFGSVIKTVGQIKSSPKNERIISARTNGIIHFADITIAEGGMVSAGRSLFFVESSGMADNNLSLRYQEAEAKYKKTKMEYERKKILSEDKIISERELSDSEVEYKQAQIVYHNLKKNFAAGKQTVSSPIEGYIQNILVRNGEFVQEGQPILTVSTNKELLIRAELRPKLKRELRNISSVYFKELNGTTVYSLEDLDGKLLSYGQGANDNNPLIPISFLIRNTQDLVPGNFLELYINTESNREALVVDNRALVEEMGTHFVFVQVTPELFEKRAVKVGYSNGIETEILSGIKIGERIVSKGAIMLKLSQGSEALDAHAGHAH